MKNCKFSRRDVLKGATVVIAGSTFATRVMASSPAPEPVTQALIDALDDTDATVRQQAAESLAKIDNAQSESALRFFPEKEWIRETRTGQKRLSLLLKAGKKHPIEQVGTRLRAMMAWESQKRGRYAGSTKSPNK